MLIAITRAVSRSIVNCELTYLARTPIDIERARRQHAQYEGALRSLGVTLLCLPEEPALADSVFVEDTALVLDECAVILRPGADSRLAETESIAKALAPYRPLRYIKAPGRIDGGDILCIGKQIYIGLSRRSDPNAIAQIQEMLAPYGYTVQAVPIRNCLHLKSAASLAAEETLLINPAWVDRDPFAGMKFIEVDPTEPYAANAVRIGKTLLHSSVFLNTRRRLEAAQLEVIAVEADELAKAEGAVTCCSILIKVP